MSRFLRRCFVVLVCSAVCEIPILMSSVVYWRMVRLERIRPPAPKEQHACIPYNKYVIAEEDSNCPDGFKKESRRGKYATVCCGNISLVFEKIIPKVISLHCYIYDPGVRVVCFESLVLHRCRI